VASLLACLDASSSSPSIATDSSVSRRPASNRTSPARPPGAGPGYVEFRIGDYQHELGIMYNRHYLDVLGNRG